MVGQMRLFEMVLGRSRCGKMGRAVGGLMMKK